MLKTPSPILMFYDELLVKMAVPELYHFLYQNPLIPDINEGLGSALDRGQMDPKFLKDFS